ncbi:MAG: hypothetical protein OEM67_04465 [Thermoleophilia bacterium]|nr:hypothetical protein [Thermoleophilia bacterium]
MAYMITHFYEGGTAGQYEATLNAAHPPGGLPVGQEYHAAGPCEGGWLVVAVWDSKASCDRFIREVLMPTLPSVEGGFAGPPQERTAEVANLLTA